MQDRTSSATRLSYAASDIAGQLLFCWIIWYVPYFYTDTCKIPASAVAAILLATRFLDALDAPLWGILVDRTRSRWGKSRPWFLWLCLPFASFGVLTFLTPDLGYRAKLAYAAVTYAGCNFLFTGINTPVTSILPALTANPKERLTLTTFRMLGSKLGVLVVNLTGMALVHYLGHGNDRPGFMLAVPIFAGRLGRTVSARISQSERDRRAVEDAVGSRDIQRDEGQLAVADCRHEYGSVLDGVHFSHHRGAAFLQIRAAPARFARCGQWSRCRFAGHGASAAVALSNHAQGPALGSRVGGHGAWTIDPLARGHAWARPGLVPDWLDRRVRVQWGRDDLAVFHVGRHRGLRRMEERRTRRRAVDCDRRCLLLQGGRGPGWCRADVASPRWRLHRREGTNTKLRLPRSMGASSGVPAVCFALALLPACSTAVSNASNRRFRRSSHSGGPSRPARIARGSAVEVRYSRVDEEPVEIAGGGVAAT